MPARTKSPRILVVSPAILAVSALWLSGPALASGETTAAVPGLVREPVEVSARQPSIAVAAKAQESSGSPERTGIVAVKGTPRLSESKFKESLNRWTIGLAAGRIEGAPLRLAAELAQALDDGDNLRVMPIVTRGPFDNFRDLLHLRGVDLAIVYGDTLDHFKNKEKIANVDTRVMFVANLFPAEIHVLARPEINSMKDLDGKVVNFNTQGTAAAFTGPLVFERLGIKIQARFLPHRDALEKMKAGDEVAATFWVTSKPIAPLATPAWPAGFKLIPVPYEKALEEYYLPASLETADYPKLVPQGQKIATIAVPTVLAAYNWPADTDRARRITRMIDRLFERWPELHKAPNDPKWKDVNLASSVPGWRRYPLMQAKLDQMANPNAVPAAGKAEPQLSPAGVTRRPLPPNAPAKAAADPAALRRQAERAAPSDKAEQERLFQQYMQWSKQR